MIELASRYRRNVASLVLVVLVVLGSGSPAFAQSGPSTPPPAPAGVAPGSAPTPNAPNAAGAAQAALDLRRKGNAAMDAGRYEEAIGFYEEALKLDPGAKLFYNTANAYERVGRYADALTSFLRFKQSASRDELDSAPNLDKRLATLRTKVADLAVSGNVPGAHVRVRNVEVGQVPPSGPLEVSVNAGRADVEIAADGYRSYRAAHELEGGRSTAIKVRLVPNERPAVAPERAASDETASPLWSQWWFWAGAGALVAGSVITIYALSSEKSPGRSDWGDPIVSPKGSSLNGLGLRF
jgi:tetratricopeptide repeat protein/PEGA domain-containing protein